MHLRRPLAAAALLLVLAAPPALAQSEPSTREMIEQLQQPRTRSLRNLQVERASPSGEAAAPAQPPSLSLSVQFQFDSAAIQQASKPLLSRLAEALKAPELAQVRFAVEGHTDSKGSADYNTRLSLQRAAAVRDFLVHQGIAADRLEASGKGSSEPARPDNPSAPENRRVRIVALAQ